MKSRLLRSYLLMGLFFSCLAMSAYEQGDTILVGSDTDTTVFLEAEWYNPDSVTTGGASSVGATLNEDGITAYLMNNKANLFYVLDVKGDGGTYDVVFSYKSKRFDRYGYFYIDLDGVRHGQINAKNRGIFEGHPAWMSSYQNVSTDANRNYVSLTLTPGKHKLNFNCQGGSGNFYCDYFALVPRLSKTTTVACTSYDDTTKIEAEFYDPSLSTISSGKTTVCVHGYDACIGNNNNGDKLVFPLTVGSEGGTFKVEYIYAKLKSTQSARFRPFLDDADYWGMYNLTDTATHSEWSSYISNRIQTLSTGAHKLTVQMDYSESHFLDAIRLIPIELTGVSTTLNKESVQEFVIFPNPTINKLNISGAKLTSATIYDFTGHQIISQSVSSNTLDVSSIKAGIYLLEVTDEAGVQSVLRFVKK